MQGISPSSLGNQYAASVQGGGSPLNIMTPGSAGFQPQLQTPQAPNMPSKSPMSQINPPSPMLDQNGQPVGHPLINPPPPLPPHPVQNQVTLPIQDSDPNQPGIQIPATESELILKALDHRLKALSKIHLSAAQAAYEPGDGDEHFESS